MFTKIKKLAAGARKVFLFFINCVKKYSKTIVFLE